VKRKNRGERGGDTNDERIDGLQRGQEIWEPYFQPIPVWNQV
jgi:hypothetical protein